MEEAMSEVKINEQTTHRLFRNHPSHFQREGLGVGSYASE